ncbi:uncharacterized protein MONBRDRAFT_22128 [Monosiga brevicollis MX1]|uniref:Uncharacterized protein n=1 Tax=Monosiga brevicollis TaxID=81824 RepID=A9UPN0_MONBE|nr:uncharacterized protein MONBRDRAFT_22128 [Monosiga brevicollis MX1]EDQ92451.1 predicted protein [Monosiga brevicollis MX1]|eukprot:XP_001742213.1 hypothetical protein [Monosiga brevicollis MX1]
MGSSGRPWWRIAAGLVLVIVLWLALSRAPPPQPAPAANVVFTHQRHMGLVRNGVWQPFGQAYDRAVPTPLPRTEANRVLAPEILTAAQQQWQSFAQNMPTFTSVRSLFHERGIVMSGGHYQLNYAYAAARMLRQRGCTLPIELWLSSGRNESLTPAQRQIFSRLGVDLFDTDAAAAVFPAIRARMHTTKRGDKPYVLKQIALISSRCRECLLLDVDNIPMRDPTYLFEALEYRDTGHLLWPDLWHMRGGQAYIRTIFGLPSTHEVDIRTVESGVMVVDKARAWRTLLLSTFMQIQTHFYDNLMRALSHLGGGGDKQTFWIACKALNASCAMIDTPVASAGRIVPDTTIFCGREMIQHDHIGQPLFVHSNMDKERFQKAVAATPVWSESLRRAEVIRRPREEASWSVAFTHQPDCGGGGWVVQITSNFELMSLREAAQTDFEQERYAFMREYMVAS